jgi:antitoxin component YwqK of YwqJK toxin-antitoxin module
MIKKLLYLLPLLFLLACQSVKIEKVEEKYPDNKKKIVRFYQEKEGKEILLEEKHFHQNGKLKMNGKFLNGKRDGEWMSYFPNDQLQSTGTFINGVRTGAVKVYQHNGTLIYEGFFKEGKEFGHWKFYTSDGKLAKEEDF